MLDHVHDCTGPDATCPCGYVVAVLPISFSLDVFDHNTELVSDGFNCDHIETVIDALRKAADKLESIAESR